MKNAMYSNDILWYDPMIKSAVESLAEKYSNAIPIFGGALGAYNYVNSDTPDFKSFMLCLSHVASSAKFFKWHEGVAGAVRRFCRICLVDPALVELYLGARLNEVFS